MSKKKHSRIQLKTVGDTLFVFIIIIIPQAFVISFTSDFIPRLVYQYVYSPDGTMHGFVNHTLSHFNVSHFQPGTGPQQPGHLGYPVYICRYDFRLLLDSITIIAIAFFCNCITNVHNIFKFVLLLIRYKDYREPPWSSTPYEFSKEFWVVLAARLAFVIFFQV